MAKKSNRNRPGEQGDRGDPSRPPLISELGRMFAAGLDAAGAALPGDDPEEDRRRREARTSMAGFVKYTKADYVFNWHHRLICRLVDRMLEGDVRRAAVFAPPRSGKTEIISRRMPAYVLGRNPDAKFMACSCDVGLAADNNRDLQQVMDDPAYRAIFPGTMLWNRNVRTTAQGTWLRNSETFQVVGRRGRYFAKGVGGSIVGRGFDWGIIDDPVAKAERVDTLPQRDKLWQWYLREFWTRQAPGARILLILTRWHDDDLAGRLIRHMKEDPSREQWEILRLPAVADGDLHPEDLRAQGEVLWPDLLTPERIAEAKSHGTRSWSAEYQQDPAPQKGAMYRTDTFRTFTTGSAAGGAPVVLLGSAGADPPRVPPEDFRWFQVVDTAIEANADSKYTACGTFAFHRPSRKLLVWHFWRAKLLIPEQLPLLYHLRHGAPVWDSNLRLVVAPGSADPWPVKLLFQAVEAKASGPGLIQAAQADGKPFRALSAQGSKEQRAALAVTWYENGMVLHREGAVWLPALEQELLRFPSGVYTDMADCVAYAVMLAAEDVIVNAGQEGEILVWPPPPTGPDGRRLTAEEFVGQKRGQEYVDVGGVRVVFDDEDDGRAAWN